MANSNLYHKYSPLIKVPHQPGPILENFHISTNKGGQNDGENDEEEEEDYHQIQKLLHDALLKT